MTFVNLDDNDDMEEVELIANSWYWRCPSCGHANEEDYFTGHVTCAECGTTFSVCNA